MIEIFSKHSKHSVITMEEENSTPVDSSTESDTEVETTASHQKKTVTSQKPGIVYLSTVPTGFNVSQTTTFFTEFGRLVELKLTLKFPQSFPPNL